ncbi:hypothetical protein RSSM_06169 [Rhodopirellula sallentina SM41]|uniref:Uncharacterized protein n=1 Tax=Rhodopirellula sallentina SM41 TaxID=1263870 RepID=M5TTD6_9BACT|nr:hypothetical protein RSSM_06169 [Rhodopirellula sallentina SM41]
MAEFAQIQLPKFSDIRKSILQNARYQPEAQASGFDGCTSLARRFVDLIKSQPVFV